MVTRTQVVQIGTCIVALVLLCAAMGLLAWIATTTQTAITRIDANDVEIRRILVENRRVLVKLEGLYTELIYNIKISKSLLTNQSTIISNQSTIVGNQTQILKNHAEILENERKILERIAAY